MERRSIGPARTRGGRLPIGTSVRRDNSGSGRPGARRWIRLAAGPGLRLPVLGMDEAGHCVQDRCAAEVVRDRHRDPYPAQPDWSTSVAGSMDGDHGDSQTGKSAHRLAIESSQVGGDHGGHGLSGGSHRQHVGEVGAPAEHRERGARAVEGGDQFGLPRMAGAGGEETGGHGPALVCNTIIGSPLGRLRTSWSASAGSSSSATW